MITMYLQLARTAILDEDYEAARELLRHALRAAQRAYRKRIAGHCLVAIRNIDRLVNQ